MESDTISSWWGWVEPHLHRLGPLSPTVSLAGTIVTAGIAVAALCGRSFLPWPTSDAAVVRSVNRFVGLVAGILLALMYIWSMRRPDTPSLLPLAIAFPIVGAATFFLYLLFRRVLTVTCIHGETTLAGFRLLSDARKVLRKSFTGLPPDRQIKVGTPPNNVAEYYCTSGHDPKWIWTEKSMHASWFVMLTLYAFVIISLSAGLGALSIELKRAQPVEEKTAERTIITIPSLTLFDFDSAKLTPSALAYLSGYAAEIKISGTRNIEIKGHTDGLGSLSHNQDLSLRRASAVKDWLAGPGGLAGLYFKTEGLGSSQPKMKETDSRGHDIPEARKVNRRVEIIFEPTAR